jgi:hypothetical protein
MGFWDFLKKKKEKVNEKVSREELLEWVLKKKQEIEEQEREFLALIKKRISQFILEINEKLPELRDVNINEKKTERKIKLIVKENLKNYIYHLERLIERIKKIDEKKIIEQINFIFYDFRKKSSINYEKATILIGKEIGEITKSIRKFIEDIKKIIKDNESKINIAQAIQSIEIEIKRLNEIEKAKSSILKEIKESQIKIDNLKNAVKAREEKIKEIKKSEKFLDADKKKDKLKIEKQELKKDLDDLKSMIDFKSLANFYHSFEKEMGIIKEYKEDFYQKFIERKGEDMLFLLKESNLQKDKILDKIQKIRNREKEINNIIIEETGIEKLEESIRNFKSEIEYLNLEKLSKEKKMEKMEKNADEVIQSIKINLNKINVDFSENI